MRNLPGRGPLSCQRTANPDQEALMDQTQTMEQAWLEAINAHDVQGVLACFTDDAVFTDVGTGQVARGKDEMRAMLEGLFATFSGLRVDLRSAFGDGNSLVHEFTMSGVHSGSVPGLEATGKSFTLPGAIVADLRDGRLSRATEYWNMADLLTQVGVLPRP